MRPIELDIFCCAGHGRDPSIAILEKTFLQHLHSLNGQESDLKLGILGMYLARVCHLQDKRLYRTFSSRPSYGKQVKEVHWLLSAEQHEVTMYEALIKGDSSKEPDPHESHRLSLNISRAEAGQQMMADLTSMAYCASVESLEIRVDLEFGQIDLWEHDELFANLPFPSSADVASLPFLSCLRRLVLLNDTSKMVTLPEGFECFSRAELHYGYFGSRIYEEPEIWLLPPTYSLKRLCLAPTDIYKDTDITNRLIACSQEALQLLNSSADSLTELSCDSLPDWIICISPTSILVLQHVNTLVLTNMDLSESDGDGPTIWRLIAQMAPNCERVYIHYSNEAREIPFLISNCLLAYPLRALRSIEICCSSCLLRHTRQYPRLNTCFVNNLRGFYNLKKYPLVRSLKFTMRFDDPVEEINIAENTPNNFNDACNQLLIDLYSLVRQDSDLRLRFYGCEIPAIGHGLEITEERLTLFRSQELPQASPEVQRLLERRDIEVNIREKDESSPTVWDDDNLTRWIRRP